MDYFFSTKTFRTQFATVDCIFLEIDFFSSFRSGGHRLGGDGAAGGDRRNSIEIRFPTNEDTELKTLGSSGGKSTTTPGSVRYQSSSQSVTLMTPGTNTNGRYKKD